MTELTSPATLFDLSGRCALVTGATGAFGSAAARALAGAGAHVTLAGGNQERLASLAAELSAAGAEVAAVTGRPIDEEAVERIVGAAVSAAGGLDIFVGASGTSVIRPILDMDVAAWDRVMDANVRQNWLLCRSVGRVMQRQGRGGKIVLVSSVRARFAAAAGTSAYGCSKAAIDMLTRSLAAEWGKFGINVNAVAPTVFRSELTAWLFEKAAEKERERVLARIPIGRLSEPEDFAGIIVFLCSRASDIVTGEIINADGGFSCN